MGSIIRQDKQYEYYPAVRFKGEVIKIGDPVKLLNSDSHSSPHLGVVLQLFKRITQASSSGEGAAAAAAAAVDDCEMSVQWFYRQSDLPAELRKQAQPMKPQEILLSDHVDTNSVLSVIGKCFVQSDGTSHDSPVSPNFVCNKMYFLKQTQWIEPLPKQFRFNISDQLAENLDDLATHPLLVKYLAKKTPKAKGSPSKTKEKTAEGGEGKASPTKKRDRQPAGAKAEEGGEAKRPRQARSTRGTVSMEYLEGTPQPAEERIKTEPTTSGSPTPFPAFSSPLTAVVIPDPVLDKLGVVTPELRGPTLPGLPQPGLASFATANTPLMLTSREKKVEGLLSFFAGVPFSLSPTHSFSFEF